MMQSRGAFVDGICDGVNSSDTFRLRTSSSVVSHVSNGYTLCIQRDLVVAAAQGNAPGGATTAEHPFRVRSQSVGPWAVSTSMITWLASHSSHGNKRSVHI